MIEGQGQFVYHIQVTGDDEEQITTIGFNATTTDPGDLDAWASQAFTAWDDFIAPNLANVAAVTSVEAQKHMGAGIASGFFVGSSTGGIGTGACPSNCAWLVRKHTNTVGHGKTGRMYIPGVPEADVSHKGEVGSTPASAWESGLEDYLASFPTGFLVVNHGPTNLGLGDFHPILSLQLDAFIGTQRRRMRH